MGRKTRKNYSVDEGVAVQFQKICKKNEKEYSAVIEDLMKEYVARDGQALMDDLYAPRIQVLVEKTVRKEIDRLARMLYNINVDVTAGLYAFPAMYKKTMNSIETTLDQYINEQLLSPNRKPLSQEFKVGEEGERIIDTIRNYSRKSMKIRQRERALEKETEA
jgi:hypothetical protein